MVVLGDHETETENPLQAQAMRLQLYKSLFTQAFCQGGTWGRSTDRVCTGELRRFPVLGPQWAPSAGAAQRGITGDTQIPR